MKKQLADSEIRQFESVRQIQQYHDGLVERINRHKEADVRNHLFPIPPVQGSENILALDSPGLLIEEARAQHNCVMSHAGNIARGGIYLYRMLKPERATLSIIPNAIGHWELDEISGPCNEDVSEATHQAAARWLSGHANEN